MQCKLQVETPSDHTYSLFWAELSRLLGEKKIPVAIVGLEPGTPGSAVQRFNHLATKQPLCSDHPYYGGERTDLYSDCLHLNIAYCMTIFMATKCLGIKEEA